MDRDPVEFVGRNDPWYTSDQMAGAYNRHQRRVTIDAIAFIVAVLADICRWHGPARKLTLLDAGCGDGVLLAHLVHMGNFEVYGVDYNLVRVERARRNSPQAIVKEGDLTSLTSLGFGSGFFDVIVASQVLEHISEDTLALTLMADLLNEDGVLILGVPNEGCLLAQLRNKVLQPSIERTTDHVNFYTEKTIVSKLTRAGFIAEKVERTGFFHPHEVLSVCLNSWSGGYKLTQLAGRILKSQVAGFHLVCRKGGKDEHPTGKS